MEFGFVAANTQVHSEVDLAVLSQVILSKDMGHLSCFGLSGCSQLRSLEMVLFGRHQSETVLSDCTKFEFVHAKRVRITSLNTPFAFSREYLDEAVLSMQGISRLGMLCKLLQVYDRDWRCPENFELRHFVVLDHWSSVLYDGANSLPFTLKPKSLSWGLFCHIY